MVTVSKNEGFRALGRYVYEFSQMVAAMQGSMVFHLQHPGKPPMLAWIALGTATARDIADMFFAMGRELVELAEDEKKTVAKLYKEVVEEIKFRNTVAHGDWQIGWYSHTGGEAEPVPLPPTVSRILPSRMKGPYKAEVPDLDAHSDCVEELRSYLWSYATVWVERSGLRLRDLVQIESGRLIPGPKATGS